MNVSALAVPDQNATRPVTPVAPRRWGWPEDGFLVIFFLSSGLLLIPGAQAFRMPIRAVPYVAPLIFLLLHLGTRSEKKAPPGARLMLLALVLLTLNLFHPETRLLPGLAHWAMTVGIAAPLFWAYKLTDKQTFWRVLNVCFVCSAANAFVGLLQVYFPDRFLPAEFFALDVLKKIGGTYIGAEGQRLFRPPGLSNTTEMACFDSALSVLLGLILGTRGGLGPRRVLYYAGAAVGMFVLYLTFARSLTIMMVVGGAAFCALLARGGRLGKALTVAAVGFGVVTAGFAWALTVGGRSLEKRFIGTWDKGVGDTWQRERSSYYTQLWDSYILKYPLGIGLGRWGMPAYYFGGEGGRPPKEVGRDIFVHVSPSGWVLDGGVPMLLLYGGAVCLAPLAAYRLARSAPDPQVRYMAAAVCSLDLMIIGMCASNPIFSSPMGLEFWLFNAVLHGAATSAVAARPGVILRTTG
jgi:hypothetical protein